MQSCEGAPGWIVGPALNPPAATGAAPPAGNGLTRGAPVVAPGALPSTGGKAGSFTVPTCSCCRGSGAGNAPSAWAAPAPMASVIGATRQRVTAGSPDCFQ